MVDTTFWKGKKIFLTGHTGFKGSWLSLWLHAMGAEVTGYALDPPTEPSLFKLCRLDEIVTSIIGDVRDLDRLKREIVAAQPEIIFHMAAQPLVRDSYRIPVDTYEINVMGTVHLLESVRCCANIKSVVNVTTDKCYENREGSVGFRESDPLGGYDPYSSSKACSELITAAYRSSFFNPKDYSLHGVAIASARAGNVIGGGDWAADRLIPDCIRALLKNESIVLRNPEAIRPWQHVLEPLSGYLLLAERLCSDGVSFSGAWNFGPGNDDARSAGWIVQRLCSLWGDGAAYRRDMGVNPHETSYLMLDSDKAFNELGWAPRWSLERALESIICWSAAYRRGLDVRQKCMRQIKEYEAGQ
jgi:CDP-glucose 4,6-dehydratase